MTLTTNGAMFEFMTEGDERFAMDYYDVVDTDIPLWAVKEELLHLMETHHITHFRVPGTKTRNHQDYVFHFDVEKFDKTNVKLYKYLYHEQERGEPTVGQS